MLFRSSTYIVVTTVIPFNLTLFTTSFRTEQALNVTRPILGGGLSCLWLKRTIPVKIRWISTRQVEQTCGKRASRGLQVAVGEQFRLTRKCTFRYHSKQTLASKGKGRRRNNSLFWGTQCGKFHSFHADLSANCISGGCFWTSWQKIYAWVFVSRGEREKELISFPLSKCLKAVFPSVRGFATFSATFLQGEGQKRNDGTICSVPEWQ